MRREKKPRRREQHVADLPVVTPETVAEQRASGLLSRITTLPLRTPAPVASFTPAAPPSPTTGTAPTGFVARPAPAPAPARASAPAPAPAPAPVTPVPLAADLEATTVRPRDYDVRLPDGRHVPISRQPIVIGRSSPSPLPPPAGIELVTLDDPERSISRHHLRIELGVDGAVWATDLDSGNGTTLISTTGEITELPAQSPVRIRGGSALSLGDRALSIVRRRP